LSHSTNPSFWWWFFSIQSLMNYLPELVLNRDPSDLCLLSSKDSRHKPPVPSCLFHL
jgi:hypothetical protein